MAPSTVALLLLAWTILPGSPLVWTAAVLAALAFNLYPLALATLGGPPPQQPWRVFLRLVREDAATSLAQTGLQLTFLASHAWERVHAIGLTLVRLTATQRRLLEWETAAASAERAPASALLAAASADSAWRISSPATAPVTVSGRRRATSSSARTTSACMRATSGMTLNVEPASMRATVSTAGSNTSSTAWRNASMGSAAPRNRS